MRRIALMLAILWLPACVSGGSESNNADSHTSGILDALVDVGSAADSDEVADLAVAVDGALLDGASHPDAGVNDTAAAGDTSADVASASDATADATIDSVQEDASTAPLDIPLTKMAAAFAKIYCELMLTCEPVVADSWNVPECPIVFYDSLMAASFAQLAQDIADGKVIYDGVVAAACVEAFAANGCISLSGMPAVCEDVFVGNVPTGSTCISAEHCADGWCYGGANCPGICLPFIADGDACVEYASCGSGSDCSAGTCQPEPVLAMLGQACAAGPNGNLVVSCETHLVCVENEAGASVGTCKKKGSLYHLKAGNPCQPGDYMSLFFGGLKSIDLALCQSALSCVVDSLEPSPTGTCQAAVVNGKACGSSIPDQCPAASYCHVNEPGSFEGVCQSLPVAGETCLADDATLSAFTPTCALQFQCVADVCVALTGNGAVCTFDDYCSSGYCDPNTLTCALEPACNGGEGGVPGPPKPTVP